MVKGFVPPIPCTAKEAIGEDELMPNFDKTFKLVIVEVVIVVLLKLKFPLLSDMGMYCVLETVFTPTPSKYLAFSAYGTEVICFLGVKVSDPILTSKNTDPLF